MTVATSVTAPPTWNTCRALYAWLPNPDSAWTVAREDGGCLGGTCSSCSAWLWGWWAARGALPLPLARPFGAYAFMLTCISRYSGGLSTVQLQADPADPLTGSGDATLGGPGRE